MNPVGFEPAIPASGWLQTIKIVINIIFPVVWYGCDTWSLKLKGEHRLRMFEYAVTRKIISLRQNNV
jgi:hypothetical protein